MKRLGWLWVACLTLGPSTGREVMVDHLRFYTQWDDTYLYFAAYTDDVNIVGERTRLAQPVYLDDDLELFFQTTPEATPLLTEDCWWLAMSVAQGVVFRRGSARGEGDIWEPSEPALLGARFRQAITIDGTLNDPTDQDTGWIVEAAIPWRAMGRDKPQPNESWGFNVVRHLRGETDGRFSYIPTATLPTTQVQPNTWGRIVFRDGAAGEAWLEPGGPRLVCPRAMTTATGASRLVIDGRLEPGEWPLLHQTALTMDPDRIYPMPHEAFTPPAEAVTPLPEGSTFVAPEVPAREARQRWTGERLVLAPYRLDYQDDPALPGGTRGVRGPDGAVRLALQPDGGLGPWFSGLRVDWQHQQLAAAAALGIGHLAVAWDGGTEFSRAALASLVTAAVELRAAGQHVPAVAPMLTTAALAEAAGPALDLTQPVAQAALWRMLRDFYERVPQPFRSQFLDGPRRSLGVVLGPPPEGLRVSESLLAAVEMYSRAALGHDLLWIGSGSWGRRAVPVDAVMSVEAGQSPAVLAGERLISASVGPGYNDLRSAAAPAYVDRRGNLTFREGLNAVLRSRPDWLWLQSFNDFERGDAVAATVETQQVSTQAARVGVLQFNAPGEVSWSARLRQVALPRTLIAGQGLEVPLVVANAGMRPWRIDDGVQVACRWYTAEPEPALNSDGSPATDPSGRPVLRPRLLAETSGRSGDVVADSGGAMTTSLRVTPQDDAGVPLPPGRYLLRFDLSYRTGEVDEPVLGDDGEPAKDGEGHEITRRVRQESWFSLEGDSPHDVEVEVTAPAAGPAGAGQVLDATLPGRLPTGQPCPVAVRVRNDGGAAWDEGVRLAVRFVQRPAVADPAQAEPEPAVLAPWQVQLSLLNHLREQRLEALKRVGADPAAAPPITGIAPGDVAEVRFNLALVGPERQPLPPGAVVVEMALVDREGRLLPTAVPWRQAVELVAGDPGGVFQSVSVPSLMRGGEAGTASAVVANRGAVPWAAGSRVLTVRWLTLDGLPCGEPAPPVPLGAVAPGAARTVSFAIVPPAPVGVYRLLCEVRDPASSVAAAWPSLRSGELRPQTVVVVRGQTRPVDLSLHVNARIAAAEGDAAPLVGPAGGWVLPAEALPPYGDDQGSGLYPSGYLRGGADSLEQHRIVFSMPQVGTGPSAVQPAGQPVELVPGAYTAAHVLGFATEAGVSLALQARRAGRGEVMDTAPVAVPPLVGPAVAGARPGWVTDWLYGPDGRDLARRGTLWEVVVPLDPSQPLDALVLPTEPRLRIVAITLVDAAAPAATLPAPPAAAPDSPTSAAPDGPETRSADPPATAPDSPAATAPAEPAAGQKNDRREPSPPVLSRVP